MQYSRTIVRTVDANHDQVVVRHVVDEVDVVPAVRHELVVVLAETEVAQPLSDGRRHTKHVFILLQYNTIQYYYCYTHTHTHTFNGPFPELPSRAFQFAIRIDSISYANRFDSFCKKIGLSIH